MFAYPPKEVRSVPEEVQIGQTYFEPKSERKTHKNKIKKNLVLNCNICYTMFRQIYPLNSVSERQIHGNKYGTTILSAYLLKKPKY